MLRGRVGGLFRILALVKPPGVAQPVLLPAVSEEVPHAPRPRARQCRRPEDHVPLRQLNKILRYAFLAEHPRDHPAITPGWAQAGFDDGASAWGLKEIQERKP